jgi:hypothetical protein
VREIDRRRCQLSGAFCQLGGAFWRRSVMPQRMQRRAAQCAQATAPVYQIDRSSTERTRARGVPSSRRRGGGGGLDFRLFHTGCPVAEHATKFTIQKFGERPPHVRAMHTWKEEVTAGTRALFRRADGDTSGGERDTHTHTHTHAVLHTCIVYVHTTYVVHTCMHTCMLHACKCTQGGGGGYVCGGDPATQWVTRAQGSRRTSWAASTHPYLLCWAVAWTGRRRSLNCQHRKQS